MKSWVTSTCYSSLYCTSINVSCMRLLNINYEFSITKVNKYIVPKSHVYYAPVYDMHPQC